MENIHPININNRKLQFQKRLETTPACDVQYINDSYTMLINLEEKINQELTNDTCTKLHLGCYLKDIKEKYLYKFAKYNTFEEYCDKELGISRQYAYTLIKIYEWTKCLAGETFDYTKYTISKLQELLFFSKDQLKQVDPTMTRMQIRQLKKDSETIAGQPNENHCNHDDSCECDCSCKKDEYKPTIKDFNVSNTSYDFDFFTKFGRADLSYIAWQLYSELNRIRKANAKQSNLVSIPPLKTTNVADVKLKSFSD